MALALLTATVAGGSAFAASGQATQTQDRIVLYSGDDGAAQRFKLRNRAGDEASIGMATDSLTNAHGKAVGEHLWQCMNSSLAWYCTGVIALTDAARSGAGTITFAGLFEGFNGESLALTGGTGSYAGAEGTVVLSIGGRFVRIVKLMP